MKFVVLLFCVVIVQSYRSRYCEICTNHTLCKYSVGGPNGACRTFDKEASLADADIMEIVNRINAKRNLVAIGRLKKFPQAANMRKVQWSSELASFAQRWADQCDPSVKPNREDECRDLVGMHVGQSIAAVLGPAPGLNVKSFVDMWFMLKLHYTGNVVYYNRSRDTRTDYFTQLIWADTEYVGCGRINFFNQDISTVVERVVCNFAPRGNNHGKPVYAVGFPATQCPNFMTPDSEFPGLCKQHHDTAIVPDASASSLLRILNSSNNSAKQDMDPNNLKEISYNSSKIKEQRNPKTRHTYLNNPNGAIKRDSFHMQNLHQNPIIEADKFKEHPFTPERGHSRMYHGHITKIEPIPNFQTTQSLSEQDFKRFDMITTSNPLSIQHNHDNASNDRRLINNQNDYIPDGRRIINNQNHFAPDGRRLITDQYDYAANGRRNFGNHLCTRKPKCNDCFRKPCETKQCTRGQTHSCNSCLKPHPCSSCLQPPPPFPPPPFLSPPFSPLPLAPPTHDLCPCKALPCPPTPSSPVCPSHNCAQSELTSFCAKRRAQSDAQDAKKSSQYNYYDLFTNIGLRSADENQRKYFDNLEIEENPQYEAKQSDITGQVKESTSHIPPSLQQPQDSRDTFYFSERKRRDFEDQMTFKPFWQMDEYNYKIPSELKSLRYTTLADKRNKKSRWTTTSKKLPTESITIKLEDEIINDGSHRDHATEKYLSFEEVMHLRKLSTLEALDYEIRRFGDESFRKSNKNNKSASAARNSNGNQHIPSTVKTNTPSTTTIASRTTPTPAARVPTHAAATQAATTSVVGELVARRTASETMSSITANTPFKRMKQCTRKITCTWTALMFMTGPDGSTITGIPNGGVIYNIEVGSRTPPGYVDGCTRTSTCTRDFMERNIMPVQTPGDDSSSDDSSTPEDEEYCERRSLSVQRRDLDETDVNLNIEFQEALTEFTPSTTEISHVTNRGIIMDAEVPHYEHSDCICYDDNSRSKRDEIRQYEQLSHKSYDDVMIENKNAISQEPSYIYSILKKNINHPKIKQIPTSICV